MDDVAGELAQFVSGFSAVPAAAGRAALRDVIDTVACAAAGRSADGVRETRAMVSEWAGKPEAGLWFSGTAVPAPWAAMCNGLQSHAVEFDDTHDAAILHAGITVVPAVLAAAERSGRTSGAELIAAVLVGVEVACRLALATRVGPGETGWLLTPVCGTFGAAAGAARAMGLDADRTLHALGLAYAQAAGNGQATIDGALAKRLQPGLASKCGTLAAIMAERGITGAQQVFEGRRGFYAVYMRNEYDRDRIADGLGRTFAVEALSFKPYPCCRWTHSALEAALALRARGVDPAEIADIHVAVNRQAFNSTGDPIAHKRRPRNVVDSQFSIPFSVAAALVDGHVGLEHFTPSAIARDDLLAVAEKVSVSVDGEIAGELARSVSPARLTARMRAGGTLTEEVLAPRGGPGDPEIDGVIARKFLDCCAAGGMAESDAGERLSMLSAIGEAEDAVAVSKAVTAAIAEALD